MVKKYLPFAALAVLGLTSAASAARNMNSRGEVCPPSQPAVCYPDDCTPCQRCLGPDNFAGNPPVCPHGCNGDFIITVAAFYWSAHQDGMEYAVVNCVQNPDDNTTTQGPAFQLNHLTDAEYKHPGSNWDWGFKVGLGYCSPCDGWDVNLQWTWFRDKSKSSIDADTTDNFTILPLWSDFVSAFADSQAGGFGGVAYASDASCDWRIKLNLVDFELGRNYWVSRYLSIRPFVGVRYASINQDTHIAYNGGSWGQNTQTGEVQPALNGFVDLENNYRGAGLRAGLGSEWNFGCGWAIYGNLAASIIYGRFKVNHDEYIRIATETPHNTADVLETHESLRASRAILDMTLGVQWSTLFCSCKYGFTAMLGWEQHMFFDQNQMWRVSRVGASPQDIGNNLNLNLSGDNVIQHRRGSLDTQGWTLTLKLDY